MDNITNYERIKNMSVEELAEFICGIYDDYDDIQRTFCYKFINGIEIPDYDEDKIKDWLNSEVDDG